MAGGSLVIERGFDGVVYPSNLTPWSLRPLP